MAAIVDAVEELDLRVMPWRGRRRLGVGVREEQPDHGQVAELQCHLRDAGCHAMGFGIVGCTCRGLGLGLVSG